MLLWAVFRLLLSSIRVALQCKIAKGPSITIGAAQCVSPRDPLPANELCPPGKAAPVPDFLHAEPADPQHPLSPI